MPSCQDSFSLKNMIDGRNKLLRLIHKEKRQTLLGFNDSHELHMNTVNVDHPESSHRISKAKEALEKYGLLSKCQILESVPSVSTADLTRTHSEDYLNFIASTAGTSQEKINEDCQAFDSVFMTQNSENAAREAASVCVEMTKKILTRKAPNGFAIVRPPGHHAEKDRACGFCIYNNAAQAATAALENGAKRVLIVDLDVHHGQGTQQMFYESNEVFYFSIHRYEWGKYWPHLMESNFDAIGHGAGKFYNANVPLNEIGCGDADYMFILWNVLLPMASQFDPDFVIISAGFDSCSGDPLGKMELSHAAYANFIYHLKGLANGKMLMILEGGYNHSILANGVVECTKVLLGQSPPRISYKQAPKECVIDACLSLISCHSKWSFTDFWMNIGKENGAESFEPNFKFETPSEEEKKNTGNIDQRTLRSMDKEPTRLLPEVNVVYYDNFQQLHFDRIDDERVECPARSKRILDALKDASDTKFMSNTRKATFQELRLVHTEEHIKTFRATKKMNKKQLEEMEEEFDTIFLTDSSYVAAKRAAGSVLQSIDDLFASEGQTSRKTFVVTRPPGHHASASEAMGFCLFNNVAVGAKYAIEKHGMKRVLIVDWDVHHGNGTQQIFESNPDVLFISIHRSDDGQYFPQLGGEMSSCFVGKKSGLGSTVNIPFPKGNVGDAEYRAALFKLIMPIATEFNPDLVLISCGFDAVCGDPIGGYVVSPDLFAQMAYHLSALADGKIIFVLEGGYNLERSAKSASRVWDVAVDRGLSRRIGKMKRIDEEKWNCIRKVVSVHQKYWHCMKRQIRAVPYVAGQKRIPKIRTNGQKRSCRRS